MLWIAFKNYYLRDTTQPVTRQSGFKRRCELLSKIIIFVTRHNDWKPFVKSVIVVNCFQKLLSSWHDTTLEPDRLDFPLLWIAFKNYYLRDTTQPYCKNESQQIGCELLSKIIIFVTRHNFGRTGNEYYTVVNCFQKLLSSWHDTTPFGSYFPTIPLWIAFKNYYLRDTTQRNLNGWRLRRCCELLSKIIIFVTRHNNKLAIPFVSSVVNCFQKLLSSWHDTTIMGYGIQPHSLWIAFKNYYLRDTTQLFKFFDLWTACCELLSKIIIFVTRHN